MAVKNNLSYIQSNPDSRFLGLVVKKGVGLKLVYNASDINGKGWGFAIMELKPSKAFQIKNLKKGVEDLKLANRRLKNARLDLEEDLVTIAETDLPEEADINLLKDIKAQYLAVLSKHGIEYDLEEDYEDESDSEDE